MDFFLIFWGIPYILVLKIQNYFFSPLASHSHITPTVLSKMSFADCDHQFISSLWSDERQSYVLMSGTSVEAKLCVERNRGRDGLICHFFSGRIKDQMKRNAKHTFVVAPGVWASTIIREFPDEVVKGSVFAEDVGGGDDVESTFSSGANGVIFEMSCCDALVRLKSLQPGCPCRIIRFFSVR